MTSICTGSGAVAWMIRLLAAGCLLFVIRACRTTYILAL